MKFDEASRWKAVIDFGVKGYLGVEKFFRILGEVMYPSVCVLCGDVLEYGDDRGICCKCEKLFPYIGGDLCSSCGKPLIDISTDLCYDCQKQDHDFVCGRSMWLYDELVKDAIHAFKYHGHRENGHLFAKELIRYYNESIHWPVDLVVPVPLHPSRKRRRGYNQAADVGRYLASALDIPMADRRALVRVKRTKPQKELTDKERLSNIEKAFESNKKYVRGHKILLIDDIYTTGSTVDGCTRALIDCGAEEVYYLAIAIGRGL